MLTTGIQPDDVGTEYEYEISKFPFRKVLIFVALLALTTMLLNCIICPILVFTVYSNDDGGQLSFLMIGIPSFVYLSSFLCLYCFYGEYHTSKRRVLKKDLGRERIKFWIRSTYGSNDKLQQVVTDGQHTGED